MDNIKMDLTDRAGVGMDEIDLGQSPRANYTDRATAVVGEVTANFCG
jgi:hypothetical protein